MTTPRDDIPPQRVGSKRGWLDWTAPLPDDLQRLEDSVAECDYRNQHWLFHVSERPAQDVEKLLLQHLGYVLPDDEELITRVEFLSPTIRNRRWPSLETQETPAP